MSANPVAVWSKPVYEQCKRCVCRLHTAFAATKARKDPSLTSCESQKRQICQNLLILCIYPSVWTTSISFLAWSNFLSRWLWKWHDRQCELQKVTGLSSATVHKHSTHAVILIGNKQGSICQAQRFLHLYFSLVKFVGVLWMIEWSLSVIITNAGNNSMYCTS